MESVLELRFFLWIIVLSPFLWVLIPALCLWNLCPGALLLILQASLLAFFERKLRKI